MLFANDLLNYAASLDKLGDVLIESSSALNIESPKNIEELTQAIDTQKTALKKFKNVRKSIGLIIPPSYLKDEHNELISAYEDFVSGTEQFISCVKVRESSTSKDDVGTVNLQLFSDSQYNQKLAVQKTQVALNKLAKKIEDSLK